MTERIPLFMTADEVTVLHEGIPAWLRDPLIGWLHNAADERRREVFGSFDLAVRNTDPYFPKVGYSSVADVMRQEHNVVRFLQFIDFVVSAMPSANVETLERLLRLGGSAWTVYARDGDRGLERRVPQGVQAAANAVMTGGTRAGERLATAWHEAFGMNPDPSKAYAEAVKAVEDAAIPVVVPKQDNATLGHVIGRLRNDGNWSLPLSREDPAAPSSETVLRMCQGLWKGHHDRHGGDPNAPKAVSPEEAEAALFVAVPLVQWFTSGAVARR